MFRRLGPDVHSTPADLRGHLCASDWSGSRFRVGCLVPSMATSASRSRLYQFGCRKLQISLSTWKQATRRLAGCCGFVSRSDHERGHPRPVANPAKLLTMVAPLSRSTTTFASSKIAVQRLENVARAHAATCGGRSLRYRLVSLDVSSATGQLRLLAYIPDRSAQQGVASQASIRGTLDPLQAVSPAWRTRSTGSIPARDGRDVLLTIPPTPFAWAAARAFPQIGRHPGFQFLCHRRVSSETTSPASAPAASRFRSPRPVAPGRAGRACFERPCH